jgi:hypothetical protein
LKAVLVSPNPADRSLATEFLRDHAIETIECSSIWQAARHVVAGVSCIVIVEVQTDSGDTARTWIDAVFDALAAETTPHPGGISGHFHISLDGTRVLNYAEWVDEAAHIEAVGQTGSIGRAPAWRKVQSMPGVENRVVRRYRVCGFREGSNLRRHVV